MARMVPPVEPGCETSLGEREVYRRLRDDPLCREWTVLHSLDIARHRRQLAGEADFVVLVPGKGVLCVEVKGASAIARRDGQWFYGRSSQPDPIGPFKQASENMHSLRKTLGERRPDLSGVVFWSAVMFPYVTFDVQSEEWHPWQVIDARSFRGKSLGQALEAVLDSARALLAKKRVPWFRPGTRQPTPSECGTIVHVLRPAFDAFESPRARAERISAEVKHYTAEQYAALDAMAANPRVLFEGPAGTGKTLLAIEACRRAQKSGRKVLFLCFNRLLGKWLEEETRPLAPAVKCSTLHSYMMQAVGMQPGNYSRDFWERELPEVFMNWLLEQDSPGEPFDELVVDEAQDVAKHAYMDALDLCIRGGISGGRWRFFGDFDKQDIYGRSAREVFLALNKLAPVFRLTTNCRNTPRIASVAQLVGGLVPGYSKVLRPDDGVEPTLRYYSSDDQQQQLLSQSARELLREGFGPSDIVVLSPRADPMSAANRSASSRFAPLRSASIEQKIGFCSLQAFKGREAPAVIITDVAPGSFIGVDTIFYLGATRALQELHVLAHTSAREYITRAILANLSEHAQGSGGQS